MIVAGLYLMMPQICLQFVIVVFPDHNQLLYLANFVWRPVQWDLRPECPQVHLLSRLCLVFTVLPTDVITPLFCQGSVCMVAGALE